MAKPNWHLYWQDVANAGLGLWIFVSTAFFNAMSTASWHQMVGVFMVPEEASAAIWNSTIVGITVATLALFAALAFRTWLEWANMALGIWLFVSPWILDFHASDVLWWNAVTTGILIAALAASVLTRGWAKSRR